jgi:hypothetical protein
MAEWALKTRTCSFRWAQAGGKRLAHKVDVDDPGQHHP